MFFLVFFLVCFLSLPSFSCFIMRSHPCVFLHSRMFFVLVLLFSLLLSFIYCEYHIDILEYVLSEAFLFYLFVCLFLLSIRTRHYHENSGVHDVARCCFPICIYWSLSYSFVCWFLLSIRTRHDHENSGIHDVKRCCFPTRLSTTLPFASAYFPNFTSLALTSRHTQDTQDANLDTPSLFPSSYCQQAWIERSCFFLPCYFSKFCSSSTTSTTPCHSHQHTSDFTSLPLTIKTPRHTHSPLTFPVSQARLYGCSMEVEWSRKRTRTPTCLEIMVSYLGLRCFSKILHVHY